MKTIYISIYKELHRKFGNGSFPPETAGESGREVKYCKRQAGPGFPHSSLATPLFMETIYISQSGTRAGRDNGRRPVRGSFPWCSAQPPRQRGRQAIFDMLEAKAKKR